MFNHPRRDEPSALHNIPFKASRVLNVIFCVLLIIGLRLWHLAIIQHDKKVEEAFQTRKRTVIEPAARGTIRDRFNILLAANRIEYRVSIVYSQFRDIPSVIAEKDETGKKVRRYVRREYIKKLSQIVADVLGVDANRLEDVIHSHAAQNNSIPLVIKKGLTEEQYYHLKLLEKDWQGIQVQCVPKRYYPKQRVACDVIGYLGPISKEKYNAIVAECRTLADFVKDFEQGQEVELPDGITSYAQAKMRLLTLERKVYTINDSVGLLGIEASFENELRGFCGRRTFFSDAKGNAMRLLPQSAPGAPGKRVLLSLSIELQEFAEQLLAQAESDRELAYRHDPKAKKAKEPLVRGGAIVALEPKTGQVVALASFPRYDPNDFIRTKSAFFSDEQSDEVLRWLENETYFAKVWDQFLPLTFQRYCEKTKSSIDYQEYLTWDRFLELVLPLGSPLAEMLHSSEPIKKILAIQQTGTDEDMLLVDISRLVLSCEDFSHELAASLGDLTIGEFRELACQVAQITDEIHKAVRPRWQKAFFIPWRKEHESSFLKEKRLEEKMSKNYPKPYLDYIDKEEARQFGAFWKEMHADLLLAYLEERPASYEALKEQIHALNKQSQREFLSALIGFKDLQKPLYGTYAKLVTLEDLVMGMRRGIGDGSLRSYAYRHAAIQGSLFKLVTAYAGLKQRYLELKEKGRAQDIMLQDLSLFEIVDRTYKQNDKNYVGAFTTGAPIPQIYKGGRIPKSLSQDLGRMDLGRALEVSSNPYFSLLAGDYLKDPMQLYQAACDFGFGQKTSVGLPGEMSGQVPKDIASNRTGLYSMAIGQHTLLTTPLQSALMLSAIANGGLLQAPRICDLIVGKGPLFGPTEHAENLDFPYRQALQLVGIDFPLIAKSDPRLQKHEVVVPKLAQTREIFMPKEIQAMLLDGLKRVISHIHEDRSGALNKLRTTRPEQYQAFFDQRLSLIGKTSTAESQEKIALDIGQPSIIYNHTWFGGIAYEENEPDLVVIVYQRYGGYGREIAPIAAQVIKKWRNIKGAHISES